MSDDGGTRPETDAQRIARLEAELDRTRRERDRERARLSQFAGAASDWLWEMDADLRFTFMSGRYEEVLGLPAASILGRRREDLPRTDYGHAKWRAHYEDLHARRPFRNFETDMIDADGRPRAVSISGAPVYDEDGAFRGYRGVGVDLTEQRLREREAAERKETLETILANIDEGVALIDGQGRIVAFNRRLVEFYGLEEADVTPGATLEDLARILAARGEYAGEDSGQAVAQRLQWAKGAAPVRIERRRKDGRVLAIKSNPLPAGGVTITYADITELKEAQRGLERKVAQQQAVAELGLLALKGGPVEELFDRAVALVAKGLEVDFVGLTVARTDGEGETFLLVAGVGWQPGRVGREVVPSGSRSAAGYALQTRAPVVIEDLGTDPRLTETTLLRDRGATSGMSVLVHGSTKPFGALGAYTTRRRKFVDDEVAFVQAIANVLGGALARRETERAFVQSQKMEALGRLTGGVAHDFNNLLTVILGNAELLLDELPDDGSAAALVRTLIDAGGQAAGLTRRMLQFARRQALESVRLDPNELVERMAGLIGRSLGAEIEVETRLQGDVWPIVADSAQLESALLNLAINARDAMPRGGRITVETRNIALAGAEADADTAAGDYVAIEVADGGVGMTPEVIARATEPFFTTKPSGKGTGLGLSIVYSFVRQSGGALRIESEPGRGARIRMLFPRAAEPQAAATADAPASAPRGGERVLVVEDEPQVRAFVELSLRGLGYRTLSAESGAAALALIDAEPDIDLLLTDVIMPGGMSGPELALAALLARPKLKVVYMSGYTDGALIQDGRLEAGAKLLHKPFRRAALAQMVREVLDA